MCDQDELGENMSLRAEVGRLKQRNEELVDEVMMLASLTDLINTYARENGTAESHEAGGVKQAFEGIAWKIPALKQALASAHEHADDFAADCGRLEGEVERLKSVISNQAAYISEKWGVEDAAKEKANSCIMVDTSMGHDVADLYEDPPGHEQEEESRDDDWHNEWESSRGW